MDECDMDRIAADRYLTRIRASHKTRVPLFRESRTYCLDCGEEIPEARRRAVAGCKRCVECQTCFEGTGNGY